MEMIIIAAAAAATAGLCAWLITRSVYLSRISALENMHQKEMQSTEKLAAQAQDNYERALKEMKETVTASVAAETQKLPKER